MAIVCQQPFNEFAAHGNPFGVHRVAAYLLALDGLEGASAHVEGQFAQLHTFLLEAFQHLGREMQARRWCSHRTFNL